MSQTYEVTKEITFCASHRLFYYDGPCNNIHGHNYKVQVTYSAKTLPTNNCMVKDFVDIKKKIKTWVDEYWDHSLIFNSSDMELFDLVRALPRQKYFIIDGDPTAENMCKRLMTLDKHITKVKVWETDSSFATLTRGGCSCIK